MVFVKKNTSFKFFPPEAKLVEGFYILKQNKKHLEVLKRNLHLSSSKYEHIW